MIVGRENLIKLFPNFKEDIQENGIDLRVGKIYTIDELETDVLGCVDDKKYLPTLKEVKCDGGVYILKPQKYYFVKVDKDIHIPDGYIQTYAIRSTFARCGLLLISSIGDNDFNGRLMMGLYNTNRILTIHIGENERIIQAVTYENDGTASNYEGSYQNNEIYGGK